MINRSIWNEGKLEDITSKINPSDLNIFLHSFDMEYQRKIRKILLIDKREMPQSILSIDDIK